MTHRDLDVYKLSMKLVGNIYRLTWSFPRQEVYGLASQMQRAAVSIPSNIAEGAARRGTKEFVHFLSVATGSASELETQLGITIDLEYCMDNGVVTKLLNDVDCIRLKLINLMKSLENKVKSGESLRQ